MKQIDLFAGVGAFSLAAESVGVKTVLAVEIDKYACQVLRHNFPTMEVWNNDIRKLTTDYVSGHHGKIDIITSGFPCTSYSIAGQRKGFDDPRTGDLFDQTLRFVDALKPKIFIFENVKGLLNHDSGKTWAAMLIRMGELGCYDVEWQILNSKYFGVPQNRERVFIVGHLRGESTRQVFPVGASNGEINESGSYCTSASPREYGWKNYVGTLQARYYKEPKIIKQLNNPTHSNDRVYGTNGISPCLNTTQGGNRQPFVAMRWQRTEKGKLKRKQSQKKGKDYTPFSNGCRELIPVPGKAVGTLTAQAIAKDSLIGNEYEIRRLTPLECQRLQSFPDNWYDGIEMSDSQKYKQMGNSITVNVLKEIYYKLFKD